MDATDFNPILHISDEALLQELRTLEASHSQRQRMSRLSIADMQQLLDRLHRLQAKAEAKISNNAIAEGKNSRHLLSAIFRLSADLSEQLTGRLVDTLQDKEHSIDFLQQELSKKLRDQHATTKLLRQTQALRAQTQSASDRLSLGVLI